MKKLLLTLIVLVTYMFPMIAQSDSYYVKGEKVPIVTAEISKDQLPSAILMAVNVRFDKDNPLTWSKFPHTLKEYGWVYEVGTTDNMPSHYEVTMRTTSGGYMLGFYSADGYLTETREISKNISVPRYILEALFESPYKDWKIVGNKEVINFYQSMDNTVAEQNFRLSLEKDKERKKLAFNYDVSTGKLEARVIR